MTPAEEKLWDEMARPLAEGEVIDREAGLPKPRPEQGRMLRYTITLRPDHPHDAAIIANLGAVGPTRRAARLRELALAGLTREPVRVPWRDRVINGRSNDAQPKAERHVFAIVRFGATDGPLRVALEEVPAAWRGDFLREILAAGLLGGDVQAGAPAPAGPVASLPAARLVSVASTGSKPATGASDITPAQPLAADDGSDNGAPLADDDPAWFDEDGSRREYPRIAGLSQLVM